MTQQAYDRITCVACGNPDASLLTIPVLSATGHTVGCAHEMVCKGCRVKLSEADYAYRLRLFAWALTSEAERELGS